MTPIEDNGPRPGCAHAPTAPVGRAVALADGRSDEMRKPRRPVPRRAVGHLMRSDGHRLRCECGGGRHRGLHDAVAWASAAVAAVHFAGTASVQSRRILLPRRRFRRRIVTAVGSGGRLFRFTSGSAHMHDLHARVRLREADAIGDQACAEQQAEQERQDSHGCTVARASPTLPNDAEPRRREGTGPPGFEPRPGGIRTPGPATRRRARWHWAHQDSNLEPRDYESPALTVEL